MTDDIQSAGPSLEIALPDDVRIAYTIAKVPWRRRWVLLRHLHKPITHHVDTPGLSRNWTEAAAYFRSELQARAFAAMLEIAIPDAGWAGRADQHLVEALVAEEEE